MRTDPYRPILNENSSLLQLCTPELQPFEGAVAVATLEVRSEPCLKLRPVVLQAPCNADGSVWRGWRLTTLPRFENGTRRVRLHGLEALGLAGPTFVWSPQLSLIPVAEIVGVVWAAPPTVLAELAYASGGGPLAGWASAVGAELDGLGWFDGWGVAHSGDVA